MRCFPALSRGPVPALAAALCGALLCSCGQKDQQAVAAALNPYGWKQVARSYNNEQWLISRTPRLKNLKIPSWMQPTISVTKYDLHGGINFSSRICGTGKVPGKGGYEYHIITLSSDGRADSGAASHGYKDSRWNKYWGDNTVALMVVLVKNDRREIAEFSRMITVRKTASR